MFGGPPAKRLLSHIMRQYFSDLNYRIGEWIFDSPWNQFLVSLIGAIGGCLLSNWIGVEWLSK
jgi:hypothetical protein